LTGFGIVLKKTADAKITPLHLSIAKAQGVLGVSSRLSIRRILSGIVPAKSTLSIADV
jgi:hypothetical protein